MQGGADSNCFQKIMREKIYDVLLKIFHKRWLLYINIYTSALYTYAGCFVRNKMCKRSMILVINDAEADKVLLFPTTSLPSL